MLKFMILIVGMNFMWTCIDCARHGTVFRFIIPLRSGACCPVQCTVPFSFFSFFVFLYVFTLIKNMAIAPYHLIEIDDALLRELCYNVVSDPPASVFADDISSVSMSRARHWCFTLNNYSPEDEQRLSDLASSVDYIIYGREIASTGTPHLQGFITFKTRVRRNTVIEKVGQAHFTVARNIDHAIEYCKKEGDYVELGTRPRGPGARSDLEDFKASVIGGNLNMADLRMKFSDVVARYPKFCLDFVQDHMPKKIVESHPLRPWQQSLNASLNLPPDDRTIFFVVDRRGNSGKSWFAHYYASLHDNAQVMLPGKRVDMAYALDCTIRVLFIDAPRSKQGEYIQYDFLEDVKNGYVFSPKYESRLKQLSKVHVVVMMNESPDMTKLSADRYRIIDLD